MSYAYDDEVRGTRFKRVYISSKNAVSGTPSDFLYEFGAGGIQCARDQVCYCTDILIPNSIQNTGENVSDRLYLREKVGAAAETYRIVQVEPGQHDGASLAAALATALGAQGKPTGIGNYTVTFNVRRATITITVTTGTFSIVSDNKWAALLALNVTWINPQLLNTQNDLSINDVLRIGTTDADLAASFTTNTLDLTGGTVMYLHADFCSSSLAPPYNATTVMRAVPLDKAYGYLLQPENPYLDCDFIPLPQMSLNLARFTLRTEKGVVPDLRGANISFSLLFSRQPIS
jgi:hypothetical protein